MCRKFWLMFPVLVLLSVFSGCSLFGGQLDKAASGAGKLVTFYCENVTDDTARAQFRTAVNAKAAPHSVSVTCGPADGTNSPPPFVSDPNSAGRSP